MSSLYFGLDVFSPFEAKASEFEEVYSSTAVTVFQWERFRALFKRLLPQINSIHQAQNTTTTSLS
jgi:hypothetical protein